MPTFFDSKELKSRETSAWCFVVGLFPVVLGMEHRVLHIPWADTTTELHPRYCLGPVLKVDLTFIVVAHLNLAIYLIFQVPDTLLYTQKRLNEELTDVTYHCKLTGSLFQAI